MKFKRTHFVILVAIFVSLFFLRAISNNNSAIPKSSDQRIEVIDSTLPIPKAWTGDLDKMLKRRLVRILVPYSKTLYFLDHGRERGVVHDTGREFEKRLNHKHGNKALPIRVIFIPTAREHLLQDLVDGYGDIAAGNLTVTPARQELVDFTETGFRDVNEIVVTGPDAPEVEDLEDLAGIPIHVRKTSSYYEHLVALKETIDLDIRLADEVF